MSRNLAIIGASYLQLPLIEKAKEMGYTTHVFAWAAGDVGESCTDEHTLSVGGKLHYGVIAFCGKTVKHPLALHRHSQHVIVLAGVSDVRRNITGKNFTRIIHETK